MGVASADVDPGQAGPEKRSVFLSRARSEREREGELCPVFIERF